MLYYFEYSVVRNLNNTEDRITILFNLLSSIVDIRLLFIDLNTYVLFVIKTLISFMQNSTNTHYNEYHE